MGWNLSLRFMNNVRPQFVIKIVNNVRPQFVIKIINNVRPQFVIKIMNNVRPQARNMKKFFQFKTIFKIQLDQRF